MSNDVERGALELANRCILPDARGGGGMLRGLSIGITPVNGKRIEVRDVGRGPAGQAHPFA